MWDIISQPIFVEYSADSLRNVFFQSWGEYSQANSMDSILNNLQPILETAFGQSSPGNILFRIFFGGLECVGHSFAFVANFVVLRDVWIRTQRAAIASSCAT